MESVDVSNRTACMNFPNSLLFQKGDRGKAGWTVPSSIKRFVRRRFDQSSATVTEPTPVMPMAWAEARERSITRPCA